MSSVETGTRVDGSVGLPALVLSWGSALLLAGSYSALYSLDQLLSYGDILGPHAAILQFAVMAILIGVHEGIHAVSFMGFGGLDWSEVEKQIAVNPSGTRDPIQLYVYPKKSISERAYVVGVGMPGLVLGVLPSILGLVTGSPLLMAVGVFGMGMTPIDIDVLLDRLVRDESASNSNSSKMSP
jgi:hypothetical protein